MYSERPLLETWIKGTVGAVQLDVKLRISAPWTVLFGPSGSGKSTILREIAGLRGGVPAWKRRMPLASQRAALFPNRTVEQNLTFGVRRNDQQDRQSELVKLFRLEELLSRFPSTLSGGEAQRVSVARALVPHNSNLVLLDEPFTGLDLALRDELLMELKEWTTRRKVAVLSVTHDVSETLLLNAEVIRLHEGRVVAQGPAAEVLREERARLLQQLS